MNMNCDRCKKDFEGFRSLIFTAGYYDVSGNIESGWGKFRQSPYEQIVCDECMFKDPKFIAIYGTHKCA